MSTTKNSAARGDVMDLVATLERRVAALESEVESIKRARLSIVGKPGSTESGARPSGSRAATTARKMLSAEEMGALAKIMSDRGEVSACAAVGMSPSTMRRARRGGVMNRTTIAALRAFLRSESDAT
tara:strand:+ start:380 stop:760 length:381 start_codon:yes stop_codon:yes gene_type:complete